MQVEVLLFSLFIEFLNIEVDGVSEHVPCDLAAFFPVGPIWEDTNNNSRFFFTVSLDLSDNFRFIEYCLSTNLSTDSIDFCDLWHYFLQTLIDFPELLHPLLIVEL